ncbi:RHS repeat-associated core domain-containing protein, partial [Plebeiibacterium marinum]
GLVMEQKNYNSATTNYQQNKYLYNGKEIQDDNLGGVSLDWYDYGARFYDPSLGRFTTQDPLAEKYQYQSPHVYAANNPVCFIDWMGLKPVWNGSGYSDDEDEEKEYTWEEVKDYLDENDSYSESLTFDDNDLTYEDHENNIKVTINDFTGNSKKMLMAISSGMKTENRDAAKGKAINDAVAEGIDMRKFGFEWNKATGTYDYNQAEYCVDLADFGIKSKFVERQNGFVFYSHGNKNLRFKSVNRLNAVNFIGGDPTSGPQIGFTHNGKYAIAGMVFPDAKSRDKYYYALSSKLFTFYYNSYMRQFRKK